MTRLSWFAQSAHAGAGNKPCIFRLLHPLAQHLLCFASMLWVLLGGSVLVTGCFLPPLGLDVDPSRDASPSYTPTITDGVTPQEFRFPGPIDVKLKDERFFFLTLEDKDADDTLFVRLFVDYDSTAPELFGDCSAAPASSFERTARCSAASLCTDDITDDGLTHAFEAMVADRQFLPTGDPDAQGQDGFRALPADASQSSRTWLMRCVSQ